jgi:beta-glucanase (GH16 family)
MSVSCTVDPKTSKLTLSGLQPGVHFPTSVDMTLKIVHYFATTVNQIRDENDQLVVTTFVWPRNATEFTTPQLSVDNKYSCILMYEKDGCGSAVPETFLRFYVPYTSMGSPPDFSHVTDNERIKFSWGRFGSSNQVKMNEVMCSYTVTVMSYVNGSETVDVVPPNVYTLSMMLSPGRYQVNLRANLQMTATPASFVDTADYVLQNVVVQQPPVQQQTGKNPLMLRNKDGRATPSSPLKAFTDVRPEMVAERIISCTHAIVGDDSLCVSWKSGWGTKQVEIVFMEWNMNMGFFEPEKRRREYVLSEPFATSITVPNALKKVTDGNAFFYMILSVKSATGDSLQFPDKPRSTAVKRFNIRFEDKFTGTTLNGNNWIHEVWSKERGKNGEIQDYTREGSNSSVQNDVLTITAKRIWNGRITSASLRSKKYLRYGFVVVRAKMIKADQPGTLPAIWMLATDYGKVKWPACGEIDIMEQVGRLPGVIYQTLHYSNKLDANKNPIPEKIGGNSFVGDCHEFHEYGMRRDAEGIQFFVDGKLIKDMPYKKYPDIASSFQDPKREFFMILNVSIGGSFEGPLKNNTLLDTNLIVDYVRFYSEN